MRSTAAVAAVILLIVGATPGSSAELKPQTVAAFDRYVQVTEQRMNDAPQFLWVDGLPASQQRAVLEALRRGELVIDRLTTRQSGKEIDIPDGMVHHWIGVVFVPGATVDKALSLLQDYDHHAQIYAPAVAVSKLLSRDGNNFRVYLRFMMKKVITVVVNSEHDARFTREAPIVRRAVSTALASPKSRRRDTSGARKTRRQRRRLLVAALLILARARTRRRHLRAVRIDIAHPRHPVGFGGWSALRDEYSSRVARIHADDDANCAEQIAKRRQRRHGFPDRVRCLRCGSRAP
jgi:hypothetical protein